MHVDCYCCCCCVCAVWNRPISMRRKSNEKHCGTHSERNNVFRRECVSVMSSSHLQLEMNWKMKKIEIEMESEILNMAIKLNSIRATYAVQSHHCASGADALNPNCKWRMTFNGVRRRHNRDNIGFFWFVITFRPFRTRRDNHIKSLSELFARVTCSFSRCEAWGVEGGFVKTQKK